MNTTGNIPALLSYIQLKHTDNKLAKSIQRLSSSQRVNSARDDASGLAIANKLDLQLSGFTRASQNASDGISMLNTVDAALESVHSILQRMRELAVRGANGTMTEGDRDKIQSEIDGLTQEINDISIRTDYNKMKVLNGEATTISFSQTLPVENSVQGVANRIAVPTYITESMQAGDFSYNIDSVGEAAVMTGITLPNAMVSGGEFRLNGYIVDFEAGDSASVIKEKLLDACTMTGLDLMYDNVSQTYTIATKVAGSKQEINMQFESLELAQELGVTVNTGSTDNFSASAKGKDAVIGSATFVMKGETTPDANFMSGMTIIADGNHVKVASSDNRTIEFTLQVKTNPGGTAVFAMGATTAPSRMNIEVTDYGPITLQIGPGYNMSMDVNIPRINAESLGMVEYVDGVQKTKLNYRTTDGAAMAMGMIDRAIARVSDVRSKIGAYTNRLEQATLSLDAGAISMAESKSNIMDTDMAAEMTLYSQYSVMEQAGMAILAQANQRPQQILSLLQ